MKHHEYLMKVKVYGTCNYDKHCFFKDDNAMCHLEGDCKDKGELG